MSDFDISKAALSRALVALERVVPARSSNSFLTSVLLSLTENTLTISGTSLEIDLRFTLTVGRPFGAADDTFTVPAHLFGQLVRNVPSNELQLTRVGNELIIRGGAHKTSIMTGRKEDFSELDFAAPDPFTLPGADVLRALHHVTYAAGHEAFQAVFRGIRAELTTQHTRFVASDGYRLCYETLPIPHAASQHLVLPARSVTTVLQILKGLDAPLTCSAHDGLLTLSAGEIQLNMKLMDGEYPDYTRVIPKSVQRTLTLNAANLQASVARVLLLSDQEANYRLRLLSVDGKLTLTACNDYGEATDTVDAVVSGPDSDGPFLIDFNARMLREALNGREGEIALHLTNANTPGLITDSTYPEHRAVLVPLRNN